MGNVTNVEDKIIARAASEGTSERELADRYEQAYWDELDRLDVRRPDEVPRAHRVHRADGRAHRASSSTPVTPT